MATNDKSSGWLSFPKFPAAFRRLSNVRSKHRFPVRVFLYRWHETVVCRPREVGRGNCWNEVLEPSLITFSQRVRMLRQVFTKRLAEVNAFISVFEDGVEGCPVCVVSDLVGLQPEVHDGELIWRKTEFPKFGD